MAAENYSTSCLPMSRTPTVLHPLTLPGLLHHVLTTQSSTCPTLLIICSSQAIFLHHLAASLEPDRGRGRGRGEEETRGIDDFVAPTLHSLLTTRHVRLAFCASVQALLAYLTAYGRLEAGCIGETKGKERVVLVNPLALHASTPSFSAQGLSRCFATATDTALNTGINLHIVECEGSHVTQGAHAEEHVDVDMDRENEQSETQHGTDMGDPWEQEVSILNVSARRFGSGSNERAWAGRTVKAKRIAGRWFRFHQLESNQARSGPGMTCERP